MAILTRKEMEAVIDAGGSVLHGEGTSRRIIDRKEHLPSEAELATGDREELQKARDALQTRVDKLTSEIAAIDVEISTLGGKRGRGKAAASAVSTDTESGGASDADTEERARQEHGTEVEDAKRAGS